MPRLLFGRTTASTPKKTTKVAAAATVSPEVYEYDNDDEERTLDGMTLGEMTLGDGTVCTTSLDSLIHKSVNLNGRQSSNSIRNNQVVSRPPPPPPPRYSSTFKNKTHKQQQTHKQKSSTPDSFQPLDTDDIDVRIQAYRNAVSSYREKEAESVTPTPKRNQHSANANAKDANDDDDDYTLAGVSVYSSPSRSEPKSRSSSVFRSQQQVVDDSKRSPTVRSARSFSKSPNNSLLPTIATITPAKTMTTPSTRTPPNSFMMKRSRVTDWNEKEQYGIAATPSSSTMIHTDNTSSMFLRRTASQESGRTQRASNTQYYYNNNDEDAVSSNNAPLSVTSKKKTRSKPRFEPPPSISPTRNHIGSTGLMNPYRGCDCDVEEDDDDDDDDDSHTIEYDDPTLGPMDDTTTDGEDSLASEALVIPTIAAARNKKNDTQYNHAKKEEEEEEEYDDPSLAPMDDTVCDTDCEDSVAATPVPRRSKYAKDDAATTATTTITSVDLDVSINASDLELMDRTDCAGTLRLTEEGLKLHTLKVGKANILERASLQHKSKMPSVQYNNSNFMTMDKHHRAVTQSAMMNNKKPISPPSKSSFFNNGYSPMSGSVGSQEKKRRGLGIFSRKETLTQEKLLALERERLEKEQHLQREQEEMRELQRIETMRQEYLELARQKEASASSPIVPLSNTAADAPLSPLPVIEEAENDASSCCDGRDILADHVTEHCALKIVATPPPMTVSATMSDTMLSPTLPPCVVCRINERTHIATPCMHFSFCDECVATTLQASKTCPVCKQNNVSFAQVSV